MRDDVNCGGLQTSSDALQLAAAIVLADYQPKPLPFVTLDLQLAQAAQREGFEVPELGGP